MKNGDDVSARMLKKFVNDRRLVRLLAVGLLASGTGNAVQGSGLSYFVTHPRDPAYFFTDSHANIVQATPLDRPVMSDQDLLQWATRVALVPYNVNYLNYRERLSEDAGPQFTKNGWDSMLLSLQSNHNLDEIKENRLAVRGTPSGGPVFSRSPLVEHGVVSWGIEVPIVATFENVKMQRRQDLLLKIVVIRAPTIFHPNGLAIDSLVAEIRSPNAS